MNKQDNLNYNEMLVHVPLCSHPDAQRILLVACDELKAEILKHYGIEACTIQKADEIFAQKEAAYDIIISKASLDAKEVHRVLNDRGLCAIASKSYWEDFGVLREELFEYAEHFSITMPYKVEGYVTLELHGNIFASKKYHPVADMILHKIDLLDDLVYYDSDNHIAAFVLPKAINEELLPIMKK